MYQGTNPSALRSREWLKDALLRMMEHERYASITVKDICRQADLSRQTFYQIYESKDEVIAYHFSELFEAFRVQCGDFQGITIRELACMFFRFFKEQQALVEELIENRMTYLLEQQFERFLPKIEPFQRINVAEEWPDYSVAYIAGALTQMLIHWFDRDFSPPVEVLGEITEANITGKTFYAALGGGHALV